MDIIQHTFKQSIIWGERSDSHPGKKARHKMDWRLDGLQSLFGRCGE